MFADDKFDFSYIDNDASNGAWANCWHPTWQIAQQTRANGHDASRMTDAKQHGDQQSQQPQSRHNGWMK